MMAYGPWLFSDEAELAWAAGLFEGEGSIAENITDGRWRVTMQMQMTDKDVVKRFASVVGVGTITGPYQYNRKHKPTWRWAVTHRGKVETVLTAMYPWFGTRRQEKTRKVLQSGRAYLGRQLNFW